MAMRTVLLLCLLAALAGCAARGGNAEGGDAPSAPIMTPSDFYGFCSALPTPGACLSDPICQRYRQELASPPPDLQSCLNMCRETEKSLYVANLVNGCGGILERAADLCDQFCRRRDRS